MNARVSLPVLALAAALLTLGCASGDGVPKAQVRNDTDLCMVEAAWFDDAESAPYGKGYYFTNPILKSGQTEVRELLDGTGYAYAVFKNLSDDPEPKQYNGDCYTAARVNNPKAANPGGEIWMTNDPIAMSPGKTTTIAFSEANAHKLDATTGNPTEAAKEAWRFPRITAK